MSKRANTKANWRAVAVGIVIPISIIVGSYIAFSFEVATIVALGLLFILGTIGYLKLRLFATNLSERAATRVENELEVVRSKLNWRIEYESAIAFKSAIKKLDTANVAQSELTTRSRDEIRDDVNRLKDEINSLDKDNLVSEAQIKKNQLLIVDRLTELAVRSDLHL